MINISKEKEGKIKEPNNKRDRGREEKREGRRKERKASKEIWCNKIKFFSCNSYIICKEEPSLPSISTLKGQIVCVLSPLQNRGSKLEASGRQWVGVNPL